MCSQNILARQPGPEVAEQVAVYQQNLKEKQQQLRAMTQELEQYKAEAEAYKFDIQRLSEQMETLKQQYFKRVSGRGEWCRWGRERGHREW